MGQFFAVAGLDWTDSVKGRYSDEHMLFKCLVQRKLGIAAFNESNGLFVRIQTIRRAVLRREWCRSGWLQHAPGPGEISRRR